MMIPDNTFYIRYYCKSAKGRNTNIHRDLNFGEVIFLFLLDKHYKKNLNTLTFDK